MYGRMMQASSPSPVLTALLEVASIAAEVLEARDLLRLHTPIIKSVVTVQSVKTTTVETAKVLSKRMGSSRIGVIEHGAEQVEGGEQAQDERQDQSQGGDGDEDGEGGELELRRQFCGHTLIATQIGT